MLVPQEDVRAASAVGRGMPRHCNLAAAVIVSIPVGFMRDAILDDLEFDSKIVFPQPYVKIPVRTAMISRRLRVGRGQSGLLARC